MGAFKGEGGRWLFEEKKIYIYIIYVRVYIIMYTLYNMYSAVGGEKEEKRYYYYYIM